jgi:hypothetical protein
MGIQDSPATGPWHDAILAHGIARDPSVVLGADRRLAYFVRAADGALREGQQAAPLAAVWHEHRLEGVPGSPPLR